LTPFIRLFQGSESCAVDQGHSNHPVSSLDLIAVPHPRFLVQGHILEASLEILLVATIALEIKMLTLVIASV
jgi:hypothetical protein